MAVAAMDRAFSSIVSSTQRLAADLESNLILLKITAEDLERVSTGCNEVKALADATLELVAAADELERHKAAMLALKGSYQFNPTESTDFKALCQAEIDKLPAAVAAKDHPIYKQFLEAIWIIHNAGIPMPGQEQAEIMWTTQAGVVNKNCPITGKPVTELRNPVRGIECHHIYDYDAVLIHIGRRRDVACAVAGCPKRISALNLRCDASLRMEIEELRMRAESSSHARIENLQEEDILDVE